MRAWAITVRMALLVTAGNYGAGAAGDSAAHAARALEQKAKEGAKLQPEDALPAALTTLRKHTLNDMFSKAQALHSINLVGSKSFALGQGCNGEVSQQAEAQKDNEQSQAYLHQARCCTGHKVGAVSTSSGLTTAFQPQLKLGVAYLEA